MKTIYEIKKAVRETAPHFFSRNTMKFWKQRMQDFHVNRTNHPQIFHIWADAPCGAKTVRYFCGDSLYRTYEEALDAVIRGAQ